MDGLRYWLTPLSSLFRRGFVRVIIATGEWDGVGNLPRPDLPFRYACIGYKCPNKDVGFLW